MCRCVLEVELVSHTKKNMWFVFEVELDGRTPITRPSWVMSKVSEAANKVIKLPPVPEHHYGLQN